MEISEEDVRLRNEMKKNLYAMFHKKVEVEIIDMVLNSCNYDENVAYEHLIGMAVDTFDAPAQKSQENLNLGRGIQSPSRSIRHPANLLEQVSVKASSPSLLDEDDSVILAVPNSSQGSLFPPTSSRLQRDGLSESPILTFPTMPSVIPRSSLPEYVTSERFNDMTSTLTGNTASKRYNDKTSNVTDIVELKVKLNAPLNLFLVIMRGLPGSGKSYKARQLCGLKGLIYSTDDYFKQNEKYEYDRNSIPQAHEWNQKRASKAMEFKLSPIFIDNTNTQAWEIKPYVSMGLRYKYEMMILEADTDWAWRPNILARKNSHGVPKESIEHMLARYERNVTIETVLKLINAGSTNSPKTQRRNHHDTTTNNKKKDKPFNENDTHFTINRNPRSRSPVYSINETDDANGTINTAYLNKKTDNTVGVSPNTIRQSTRKKVSADLPKDSLFDMKNTNLITLLSPMDSVENEYLPSLDDTRTGRLSQSVVNETSVADPSSSQTTNPLDEYIKEISQSKPNSFAQTGIFTEPPSITHTVNVQDIQNSTQEKMTHWRMPNSGSTEEKVTLERQNSGRIGDIVNSYRSWLEDNTSITTIDSSANSTNKIEIDLSKVDEIDMIDLTDKSEQLLTKPNEISDEQLQFSLQFIYECFPDCSKSYCKEWLKRYNGDIVKTCDYLSRLSQVNDLPDDMEIITVDDGDDDDVDVEEYNLPPELPHDTATEKLIGHLLSQKEKKEPTGEIFFIDEDQEDSSSIKISIDRRLGKELKKRFGNENDPDECRLTFDDYVADIDDDFGKKLYSCWMSSVKAKKRKLQSLLNDDERYALQLQKEENEFLKDSPDGRGKAKMKKLKPLVVDTEFSKNSPAQLKGGVFSPTSPWKGAQAISPAGVKLKDASGHVLTSKQLTIRGNLYKLFPGIDESDLDQVLEASGYNLEAASALVRDSCGLTQKNVVQNIYADAVGSDWNKVESPPRKKIQSEKPTTSTQIAAPSGQSTPQNAHSDGSLYQTMSESNQDYADFRAEANLHKNLRAECFQKAAKAFQEKRGEIAQYYADKAHQHTIKMKEAHSRAAEVTLQRRNKEYLREQKVIDLHGLHADEAVRAVKNFLDNAYNVRHRKVQIITGRGKHSKGGFSTVRFAVLNVLKQRGFKYSLTADGGAVNVTL